MQDDNPAVRFSMRIVGFASLAVGAAMLFTQLTSPQPSATPASTPIMDQRPAPRAPSKATRKKSSVPLKPVSTVKLSQVVADLGYHRFDIKLSKQDGWFDTGIPVTAGTSLLMWSPSGGGSSRWVEAMLGDTVLFPHGKNNHIVVTTSTSKDDLQKNLPDVEEQYLMMSPSELHRLKIRVFPDTAPDEIDYTVKVSFSNFSPSQSGSLTPSQEREQAELMKWDRQ